MNMQKIKYWGFHYWIVLKQSMVRIYYKLRYRKEHHCEDEDEDHATGICQQMASHKVGGQWRCKDHTYQYLDYDFDDPEAMMGFGPDLDASIGALKVYYCYRCFTYSYVDQEYLEYTKELPCGHAVDELVKPIQNPYNKKKKGCKK